MDKLTLGSLFSGSGGFELAGQLCGITPVWKSEIEPFPIAVTNKHFPNVIHLGDINTIDGSLIPPVDIITAGFCCQDLSVAGKRAGLSGSRSGLFFQIIRIVKEMRVSTENAYPSYIALENVPGMYTSNKGLDFLEVLNELVKVKNEALSVPLPKDGKWSTSGEIRGCASALGDGFSIGWRTLDAQFWGVPQRRRRCYIIVHLNGECAGKILFDETRLRGNPPQGASQREGTAGNSAAGIGAAGFNGYKSITGSIQYTEDCAAPLEANMPGNVLVLNDQGGGYMNISEDVTGTLRAQEHGHQPIVFDARGNGNGETVNTITGDHNNRITDYTTLVLPKTAFGICSQSSNSMRSANPHSGIYEAETARTLDTSVPDPNKNAGGMAVVCLEGNGSRPSHRGSGIGDDISFTLNTIERHAVCYQENRYIVRRLTPQECALLQGFPADYCSNLGNPNPTDEDIAFWAAVFETHRIIEGKSGKPKTRKQIIKWLANPHSDSAEYKLWGNGIALPCCVFVMSGIAEHESGAG